MQRTRNKSNSANLFRLFGCFSTRKKVVLNDQSTSGISNASLLPSSAVESLISIKRRDSDHCGDVVIDQRNHREASLPSSAILTNELLNQNQDFPANSENVPPPRKPVWFPFRRRKRLKTPSITRPNESNSYSSPKPLTENQSNLDESDSSLVFSPPPAQIVPEAHESETRVTLLGPLNKTDIGKKCFVIDLDETLVHSSFKPVDNSDFKVGVEIDGITHRVYVLKRPHVDAFLSAMSKLYECVLFTASLAKYADPVADFLDKWGVFRHRLFRESCVFYKGNYVKDLSQLGRPLNQTVILDNSPASYMFHATHAIQISSWFDDPNDRALLDLIPYFERLAEQPDVVDFLRHNPPPTSMAAVGTVGLPVAYLLPPSCSTTTAPSHSSAGPAGIIANIRRPVYTSPPQQPPLVKRLPTQQQVDPPSRLSLNRSPQSPPPPILPFQPPPPSTSNSGTALSLAPSSTTVSGGSGHLLLQRPTTTTVQPTQLATSRHRMPPTASSTESDTGPAPTRSLTASRFSRLSEQVNAGAVRSKSIHGPTSHQSSSQNNNSATNNLTQSASYTFGGNDSQSSGHRLLPAIHHHPVKRVGTEHHAPATSSSSTSTTIANIHM